MLTRRSRRAGGFAVQGQGGLLVKRIEGDYNNVVGFPGQVCSPQRFKLRGDADRSLLQAFVEWLSQLTEEGTLLELD